MTGFREDAHESNDVGTQLFSSKWIFHLQADEVTGVAEHGFCGKWQFPQQLSLEFGFGSRSANYKYAGSAHIHDIISAQLFRNEAWAKCPVSADINTAEKNHEDHEGLQRNLDLLLKNGR